MQKRPTRTEGKLKLKLYGTIGCKACATKWKLKLMADGKNVRVRPSPKGWEIWST
jgi:hypothetical protein